MFFSSEHGEELLTLHLHWFSILVVDVVMPRACYQRSLQDGRHPQENKEHRSQEVDMEKNPTKNSIKKDPAVLNDVAIKRTVTSRVTSVNSNPNLYISPSDALAMSHGELLRKLGHDWVAMRVQQSDFTSISKQL